MIWHWRFWLGAAELAIATACESGLALLGVTGVDAVLGLGLLDVDWRGFFSVAGLAAVVAVMKAVVAERSGQRGSPMFVTPRTEDSDRGSDPGDDQPSRAT